MGKIKLFSLITVFFAFLNFNIYSQGNPVNAENSQNSSQENVSSARSEENRFQSLFNENETTEENIQESENSGASSGIWIFVKMIFFLLIVVGLIYLLLWFFKRSSKVKNNKDPFLRSVSSVILSPGKSVQIVTFMNKAFIVGVSDNSINLIKEIDGNESEANKEMINAMNLYSDKQNQIAKPKSFNDILDIFLSGGKRDKKDLFEGVTNSTEKFVKKQQERIKKAKEEQNE